MDPVTMYCKNDSAIRQMQSFLFFYFTYIESGKNYSLFAWNVKRNEGSDGWPGIYHIRKKGNNLHFFSLYPYVRDFAKMLDNQNH